MAEVGQTRTSTVNGLTTLIDEATSTITYICLAEPGSATSTSVWQIKRIDTSVAGQTRILFADGNKNFDNEADNRTTLDYS
jgi:hypothetical protein